MRLRGVCGRGLQLPHEDAAFTRVFNQFHDSDSPSATPTTPPHGDLSDGLHDIGTHVEVLGAVDSDDEVDNSPPRPAHASSRAVDAAQNNLSVATRTSLRRRSTAERLLEDQAKQQSLSRRIRRASSGQRSRRQLAADPRGSPRNASRPDVKALLSAVLTSSDHALTPTPANGSGAHEAAAPLLARQVGCNSSVDGDMIRAKRGALGVAIDRPPSPPTPMATPLASPASGAPSRSSSRLSLSARALGAAAAASSRRLTLRMSGSGRGMSASAS